jgi:hypothetical protein
MVEQHAAETGAFKGAFLHARKATKRPALFLVAVAWVYLTAINLLSAHPDQI